MDKHGALLSNHIPHRFVDEGVKDIRFHRPSEKVLLWKENHIATLDFTVAESQRYGYEKAPEAVWVYKQGKNIKNAYWAHADSHIIFQDGDDVFLIELFGANKEWACRFPLSAC